MVHRALWLALWTLLVLYPDPRMLAGSVERALHPPIDPAAVRDLAATLPDDPRAIEAYVLGNLVPYALPWQTYGVPWYFPDPATVLARGEGDCQARAVVLASILQAKGVPARLVGSFDHLWVDYPGKRATAGENPGVALVAKELDGQYRFHWPKVVSWHETWEIERGYFWDPMPASRLALLIAGSLLALLPTTPIRDLVGSALPIRARRLTVSASLADRQ